jgi:hypothetical protein
MDEARVMVTLELDAELHKAAEQCARDCEFGSVAELAVYLLRGAVRPQDKAMDAQELALVEERLRDLGYLE